MLDSTPTDTAALNRNDFAAFYEGRQPDLASSPLSWAPSTYFHFVDSNVFAGVPEPAVVPEQQHASSGDGFRLHDELLKFCREQGLEDLARHAGLIQHGEITALKHYSAVAEDQTSLSLSSSASERQSPARLTKKGRGKSAKPATEDASNTRKRKRKDSSSLKSSKKNKGLRHFSMKVCEKVESKRTTTYNEVADELVAEFKQADAKSTQTDQKNIRRRVYDALNVLMAMGIISKEKKDIRWIGIPTSNKNTPQSLVAEKELRAQRIARKREHLEELASQHMSYTNLLARNSVLEKEQARTAAGSESLAASRIHLPFIIINTRTHTEIECEMAEDHTEYFFNFSLPFEIHDDCEILKRAGMDKIPPHLPSAASGGATTTTTTTTSSQNAHSGATVTNFSQLRAQAQYLMPSDGDGDGDDDELEHSGPVDELSFPDDPTTATIPPAQALRNANI